MSWPSRDSGLACRECTARKTRNMHVGKTAGVMRKHGTQHPTAATQHLTAATQPIHVPQRLVMRHMQHDLPVAQATWGLEP